MRTAWSFSLPMSCGVWCCSPACSYLWAGNPVGAASASRMGSGSSLSQGKLLDAAAAAAGMGDTSSSSAGMFTELLPAGCAPDAYKLFVGNVPKSFTEEELRPVSVLPESSWLFVLRAWHDTQCAGCRMEAPDIPASCSTVGGGLAVSLCR